MLLRDTATGKGLEAAIEPMTAKDFKVIKSSPARFDKFDWDKYKKREVYKIRLEGDDIIHGLISIVDHTDAATNAIEIELLEVSIEQIGSKKKIDCVGGCLIAFACRESFKRGHEGWVFLLPKTNLLEHYTSMYGFNYIAVKTPERPAGIMCLYESSARSLIRKYLD
jgi:hypothetical protein